MAACNVNSVSHRGERYIDRHHLVSRLAHLVKWFEFGVQMGVPHHVLKKIESQYATHGPDRCKRELIDYLTRDERLPEGKVIDALMRTPGEEGVAWEMLHLEHYTPYKNPSVPVITLAKESELVSSLGKTHRTFTHLVMAIQKSLEESSTPLKDIMHFTFEFFNIQVRKEPKTMIEFFSQLKRHYCFIKYDVLQVLVEEFVKASMQAQMEDYSTTLDSWLKSTTVHEFQVAIEKMKLTEDCEEKQEKYFCPEIPIVITLVQGQWMNVMIDCLKKLLDHIFKHKSILLSQIVVKKGSVIVVKLMAMQSDMLPLLSIASKIVKQMHFLGIMSIQVGIVMMTSPDTVIYHFNESLHKAIQENDLSAVNCLLKVGVVSPNALNNYFITPLCAAIKCGYDMVDTLLKHGADVHMGSTKDKSTPLQWASSKGNLKITKLLIEAGSDPNKQSEGGVSAFMIACFHNQTEIIKYLLSTKKINLNLQDENGMSALITASYRNFPSIVEILLKAGAIPDIRRNDGFSALFIACFEGYIESARLLIKFKADLNLPGVNGITPLIAACQNGHCDVVQLLIKKRANLDVQTEDGTTALTMAYCQGQMKIVSALLEAKANVNTTSNGNTILFEATLIGDVEMVNLLLHANANPNLTTDGIGPLHIACSAGNMEITNLLLRAGALVNKVGGSQSVAPLHIACGDGHLDIVELLLKYKANINVVDGKGLTPLCIVAASGNAKIAEFLLAAGANIELQQNQAGWTPLFFAVAQGHLKVVNLLIKHGASMEPNKQNETPLDIATLAGHSMIVEALQAAAQGSKPSTQTSSLKEEKRIMKRRQPLSEEIKVLPYFSILMKGFSFYKNFRESYAKSSITDLALPKEHMFENFGIQTSPAC